MPYSYNDSITFKQNKVNALKAQYNQLQATIESADTTKAILNSGETLKIQEASVTESQVNNARTKQAQILSEIASLEASLQLEPEKLVVPVDAVPMIFGTKSLSNTTGQRTMTSEWGTMNLQKFNENLLALICNFNEPDTSYTTPIPFAETGFKENVELAQNVKKPRIDFPKKLGSLWENSLSDYMGQNFMIFAFKNTDASPQNFDFKFRGLAYTTYSRMVVNIFTPNNTNANRGSITGTSFTNLHDDTSEITTATQYTVNVTIPADTSIILIFQTADKYVTTSTGGRDMCVEDFDLIFNNVNIKPDLDIIQNIIRSFHKLPINLLTPSLVNISELWSKIITPTVLQNASESDDVNAVATKSLTSERIYATNNAALVSGLTVGSVYYNTTDFVIDIVLPEFVDNAAAITGGRIAGQPYWNTTSGSKVLVV